MKADNLDYYQERDFDETVYASNSKYYYEELVKNHYFPFETYKNPGWDVEERELSTKVKLVFKVYRGNYSSQADNPDEYYGYRELIAWDVSDVVEYSTGGKVDPEMILSHQEYENYKQEIDNLIESNY